MSVQGLDLSSLFGDETRIKPIVSVAPLQAWADHAVAAPGLAAIRATIELDGLAGELTVFAGSSQLLKRVDGAARRRPWNRDPKSLDRRERAVTDAEGRWRGTMTVEFAGRDGAQVDGILADIYTDSLLATLVATLAVDAIPQYRSRSLELREALLESTRAFDLAFEESVIGLALVPLTGHGRRPAGPGQRPAVPPERPVPGGTAGPQFRRTAGARRPPTAGIGLPARVVRPPFAVPVRRSVPPRRRQHGLGPDHGRAADGRAGRADPTSGPGRGAQGAGLAGGGAVERLDELTGLLNPTAFTSEITPIRDRARRTDGTAAMYVAQIDGWDDIVATYGAEVARQLQQEVGPAAALGATRRRRHRPSVRQRIRLPGRGDQHARTRRTWPSGSVRRCPDRTRVAGHDVAIQVALGAAMVDRREFEPEELVQRARWAAARAIGHSRGELLYASYEIDADDAHGRRRWIDPAGRGSGLSPPAPLGLEMLGLEIMRTRLPSRGRNVPSHRGRRADRPR